MSIPGYPGEYTAHVDRFAREHLPAPGDWPSFIFDRPELRHPERLNCASILIDAAIAEGHADRVAIYSDAETLTYGQLLERANRIANVLVNVLGVVAGNRVLLHGANSTMLVACWLAVIKAGAIAVTTMPMLRATELGQIAGKAHIDHVLCDARLSAEVVAANTRTSWLSRCLSWGDGTLETAMRQQPMHFSNVETSRDDVCLLAFTSGTTGEPKATMHFHRDVLIMADVVGRQLLETSRDDIYAGSPPLGFTFGLGGLLVFPLRFRAAAVMIEQPSAEALLGAVERYRVTCLFTAPTMYRTLTVRTPNRDLSSLRRAVSAGEPLPQATSAGWHDATGIPLIDGLGTTEMFHIFLARGKPLSGYEAVVLDEHGQPQTAGKPGRLAVRGPTGCRYLADARQREYVVNGWNLTGDRYLIDEAGCFHFQARADDMIVSSGYNIAGPEVEAALARHRAVSEVAVIGVPDEERGQIVKAFVVPEPGIEPGPTLVRELQEFVKATIAPYKYPRAIEFLAALPRTSTGKIQRFVLRKRSGQH